MFKRAIRNLIKQIMHNWDAEDVEVYHRIRLESFQEENVERRGATAFTRIRIVQDRQIREVAVGGWLPEWPVLERLIGLSVPEPIQVPFPSPDNDEGPRTEFEKTVPAGLNAHGYVRDIMMTASGMERNCDVSYAVHRSGSILYRQRPELRTPGSRDALIFSPPMVLELIKAGAFRGLAAWGPAIAWFQDHFDGLGGRNWQWIRTPHFLRLVSGSIVMPGLPFRPPTGTPVNRMTVDHGMLAVEVNGRVISSIPVEDLTHGYAVSQAMDMFDGEMNASLPFVELKGDRTWN